MEVPVGQNGQRITPAVTLLQYFETLMRHFGPQGWWPARTRLEVILGAILTQNTSWNNAALAIRQLRRAGLLKLANLQRISGDEVATHIQSSGFYRQKASAICSFLTWLRQSCGGSLRKLFAMSPQEARRELLQVKGLGPETVDAILLYAGRHPFFVADAYTRRILSRHALIEPDAGYDEAQAFLHAALPANHRLFNELHALFVEAGKRYCRRQAHHCDQCPLKPFLPEPPSLRGR